MDDWRDHAACQDTDPDLFFPIGTTGPAIEQIDAAKAVCHECQAQRACLHFA
ncbi:MAG: WhiB family transcriptional regulator, partial [Actinomycetota bacterium]|nr:WhiB family transcriptional regulator [Actinomycetota bacterium]